MEVDSSPSTFSVASFTVKTNSWNPNPAYLGDVITGQVQGTFDPSSVDGGGRGQTFVIYNWTTAGVWYSQDGTSGTFEPYGGDGAVAWMQGQADTSFRALFNDAGYYILEVSCTATVYSQYSGSIEGTFTSTGYIGNQSDIDTSGGMGHAHKAQGLKAHAGGNGDIPVLIPQFEVDINDTPQTNDDLVGIGETTPCEIKLTSGGAAGADINLTLTAVTKPGGGNVTITPSSLTIAKGASTAAFTISGTAGSSALNDVTIHVVGGTAPQDMPVTVYHFDNPHMTVTPAGTYSWQLGTGNFGATPEAVMLTASIDLNPASINTSAPQISNYEFGIFQDGGPETIAVVASNPLAKWQKLSPGPGGFSASYPGSITVTKSITGGSDADSSSENPPFYHGGVAITAHTIDNQTDNPNTNLLGTTVSEPIIDSGTVVGLLIRTVTVSINTYFDDWCCLWRKDKQIMTYLASDGWSINVEDNTKNAYSGQVAKETGLHPGDVPVITKTTCNEQLKSAVPNTVNSPNDTFTWPISTPN